VFENQNNTYLQWCNAKFAVCEIELANCKFKFVDLSFEILADSQKQTHLFRFVNLGGTGMFAILNRQ
jgi:hypothetical protein